MPTYECECGARYRFPESAIGKKAKCKRCSAIFRLDEGETGPIRIAGEPEQSTDTKTVGQGIGVPFGPDWESGPALAVPPAAPEVEKAPRVTPLVAPPTPAQGYGQSILWTVLFPASPRNLLAFAAVWFVVAFVGMIPLISFIVPLWYAAFQFAVIESGSAGEEEIPGVTFGSDIIEDFLAPILKWIGSWALVMLPTILYMLVRASSGSPTGGNVFSSLLLGTSGFVQAFGTDPWLFILFGGGLLIWPMVILCIALGGFGALLRVDLIVVTLVKSFPAYLATLVIVAGATTVNVLVDSAISAGFAPGAGATIGGILGSALIMSVLATGAMIYCDVVMLRAIGLYYHHFKHRFVWSWG